MEAQGATGPSNGLRRSGSGSSCEDVYMGRAAASRVGGVFTNQSENLTGGLNDLDGRKCAEVTERSGKVPRAGSSCKVSGWGGAAIGKGGDGVVTIPRDCVGRCPAVGK